ncbi:MAG: type 1 glutamine amidotransferase domain-containing protein [Polyangiales bacterium]
MARRILVPLPDRDFDVTEVSVPWRILTRAGHEVVFATEHGAKAAADPLLLTGVLFGQLGAKPEPVSFYRELERDAAFNAPLRWADVDPGAFDAMLLPGGHAPGMRQYLAGDVLHAKVAAVWARGVPVAAICHGVLVLARARDAATGRSPLHGHKTTCLPKYMERTAWAITAWKLGDYYRTYPEYVEDEVRASLASPDDFVRGPIHLVSQGTADDDRHAFVLEDRHYLSARWPGDAYLLGRRLAARLG